MKKKIVTGITMGEPAGISSEITLKIWKNYKNRLEPFIFFGDPEHLKKTCTKLNYDLPIKVISNINDAIVGFKNFLPVYKIKLNKNVKFGQPSSKNSEKVLNSINLVTKLALKKKISTIVTNPIDKNIIKKKKNFFDGHTFYIAKLLKVRNPVMLLASPKIRVVPITQHISLKEAIKSINKKAISSTIQITDKYLRTFFGINKPKIAVAGLNPHAGEKGMFGTEEKKIIEPAIKNIKKKFNVSGPYPADTIFHKNYLKKFDVIICMYHDQATIPIKTLDFDNGVNLTLGLPIIRTSPDHGTALDIAGKGVASEKSLYSSIKISQDIAKRKKSWIQ